MKKQTLPYERATSGKKALDDIQDVLRGFGCQQFGSMVDDEKKEILVQFKYRNRQVQVCASMQGYAVAWLKVHPYSYRMTNSQVEHERKALKIASVAVYSILRDWIKGQVMAIESGILSFEGAFLGQILLPSGMTILENVERVGMLPAPEGT